MMSLQLLEPVLLMIIVYLAGVGCIWVYLYLWQRRQASSRTKNAGGTPPPAGGIGMSQEPKYFLISEEQLNHFDLYLNADTKKVCSDIRANPYNPQAERETIANLVKYLTRHINEENAKIRCCNLHGDAEGSNRAGDVWAAYYGALQQIPEKLQQEGKRETTTKAMDMCADAIAKKGVKV